MSDSATPNQNHLDAWVADGAREVALTLRQKVVSVEGENAVVFPPTYPGGYSMDTLGDQTKVVQIDSVGSQANRMEPLFKGPPLAQLVPDLGIEVEEGGVKRRVPIFDVGHRLGDALLRSSSGKATVGDAFQAYKKGDPLAIAKLAPTSLVFGAWDSRDSGAKLPRIVQSVLRAYDVEELHRAAQYTPPVNYAAAGVISETESVQTEDKSLEKNPLAQRGYLPIPSTGKPGGVIAKGGIWREATLNLVVIRSLRAGDNDATAALRRYILGLALTAALAPQENYLRQGCLLTADPAAPAVWELVSRDGSRARLELEFEGALAYARQAAAAFGVGAPQTFAFDAKLAKADAAEAKKSKSAKGAKATAAGSEA